MDSVKPGQMVTLDRANMEMMSLDMLRGVAETIWHNADFETPELEAHFRARYPLKTVQAWSKEQIIQFALPYKCQVRRPKPPPSDAPQPKVEVSTSNMPEHMQLKSASSAPERASGAENPPAAP